MEELRSLLRDQGADLVGFGDMSGIEGCDLPYGISVGMRLPADLVETIPDGVTRAYFNAYHEINALLDGIITAGAAWLEDRGYKAYAQTTKVVVQTPDACTRLPHKTVATRAGLGWIGKSALLVTEQFGSALRISSLLTDAPLPCAPPVTKSRCGGCRACQRICPAGAIRGGSWESGTPRDQLVDAAACKRTMRENCKAAIGEDITICGKCFAVCPHTLRYLKRSA